MSKHIIKKEEDWLALRKLYITASQAAMLVGVDPFSSPSKIKNPEPFEGNAYTIVGQMLEPVVVNVVNSVLKLHRASWYVLYESLCGEKEFYTNGLLGATPDAHRDRKTLLECKTTRPLSFLTYGVVPPDKYLIQLIVQLFCTGLEEGYLAIMSTDLTQKTAKLVWPISLFKVWKCSRICAILKEEAERFKSAKTFRVNSKLKQKVKLLLTLCYERII